MDPIRVYLGFPFIGFLILLLSLVLVYIYIYIYFNSLNNN